MRPTNLAPERRTELRHPERFPRAATYDLDWTLANQMGPNALWLAEWLTQDLELTAGQTILDMGCGRAMSSIYLAREYGVRVFANDLWIPASENWERVKEAGLADRIVPLHAEARSLPYPEDFFDAAISLDSYQYYGTGDIYLSEFRKLVKVGGQIGIVVPALTREIEDGLPEHFLRPLPDGTPFWADDMWSFHSAEWWRRHWERTGLVEVEVCDTLEDGCLLWRDWEILVDDAGVSPFASCVEHLTEDAGRWLAWVRLIARRVR